MLDGCDLPHAWAGRPQWRVLDTQFGTGLHFLATWLAWRDDPARPGLLHYAAVAGAPAATNAIRHSATEAAGVPELAPLADALCAQWHGLLPGVHRLVFEGGRVTLTLSLGALRPGLRALSLVADSVYLGTAPSADPSTDSRNTVANRSWLDTLKSVARCCRRGTRLATGLAPPPLREALAECGFLVEPAAQVETSTPRLVARYDPPWALKRPPAPAPVEPARCAVIGGGLAGAAVAASLARRGWRVQVLDAAPHPAAGASGLPAGVLAPQVAVDDPPLARLTRAGVRATTQLAQTRLRAGDDWLPGGVLEHRVDGPTALPALPALPAAWRLPANTRGNGPHDTPGVLGAAAQPDPARAWTSAASADHCHAAGLAPGGHPTLWHAQGGWVRPARLVQALLADDAIEWLGNHTVAHLARRPLPDPADGALDAEPIGDDPPPWQLLGAAGQLLAEAELVVLAAGHASGAWLGADGPPLQAVRGQVSFGPLDADLAAALPPFPVNGHGSLLAGVPDPQRGVGTSDGGGDAASDGTGNSTGGSAHNRIWVAGATYERDATQPHVTDADHAANLDRLRVLLPAAAARLAPAFASGQVRGWAGVRCATPDRLPLVGPTRQPGVWVCTGMGSRGLSLAVLCGELLAAWLQQEPLPVEATLARQVHSARFNARSA